MKERKPTEIQLTLGRWLPRAFFIVLVAWTILASVYVVLDQGWGAVCVAGIGSVIVNGLAAIAGAVYVIVHGIREKNFRWRTLGGAMAAPAASAALIFGAFALAKFGESRPFRTLWSPHTLIAALPILGIFAVHATGVINGRRLAGISLAIFGVALATPALRLVNSDSPMFGYFAFLFSFYGIGLFFGGAGLVQDRFWLPIACTMGALANLSFILGYVSFLTFVFWRRGICLARWSATLGSCLSLSVILPLALSPLALSNDLNGIYLGYGLWATSLLALAFGSWCTAIEGNQQARESG